MTKPTDPWWELLLELPTHQAEEACAALFYHGAIGCQIVDNEMLVEVPGESFGDSTPQPSLPDHALIIAAYSHELGKQEVLSATREALAESGCEDGYLELEATLRDDHAWLHQWKRYFKPLRCGQRIWVVPIWERSFTLPAGGVQIDIEPGLAFGTGQHPTTALSLAAVDTELLRNTEANGVVGSMLDVGCGSGILSIAAAKLGVAQVVGVDNDPDAVRVASENARANRCGNITFSAEDLEVVNRTFDLVVANILAPILIDLAPMLVRSVSPGGTLLLSGILAEQADDFLATFNQRIAEADFARWHHDPVVTDREWVLLTLRRPV